MISYQFGLWLIFVVLASPSAKCARMSVSFAIIRVRDKSVSSLEDWFDSISFVFSFGVGAWCFFLIFYSQMILRLFDKSVSSIVQLFFAYFRNQSLARVRFTRLFNWSRFVINLIRYYTQIQSTVINNYRIYKFN